MSHSLGLMLLREGIVTPAELVEAYTQCRGERGYERAPVIGALVAAIGRFRQAEHEDRLALGRASVRS